MVTYKIGGKSGKKIKLKEAKDLIAIRLKEGKEIEKKTLRSSNRSMLPKMVLVATFPEANVNVYRCVGKSGESDLRTRNAIRRTFNEEEQIKFAGKTLVDEKGVIHLYTENAFIKFKDDVPEELCNKLIADNGLKVDRKLSFSKNAYFVKGEEGIGKEIFAKINEIVEKDEVEYAHPELIREKKKKGVPQIFEKQWHLKKTKINQELIEANVCLEEAWEITKGEGVTIAVIDDGVDLEHPEFKGAHKIVAPRNMYPESPDPTPNPYQDFHGTACAGVACANGKDLAAGVAPEARLMPIRLMTNLGSIYEAEAFVYAADNGADIISCSWGPRDGYWENPDDILHSTEVPLPDSTRLGIEYALKNGRGGKGCSIVWAAGNGRESVAYDGYANNPEIICVAASNDSDKRSVYSDFGENVSCCFPSGDFSSKVYNHPEPKTSGIWTTDLRGKNGYNPGSSLIGDPLGDYTSTFGGTSSSTPGVAGIIALMLAVHPNLNYKEVKNIVCISCDKIDFEGGSYDENGHSIFYGFGKLNAYLAVKHALEAKGSNGKAK